MQNQPVVQISVQAAQVFIALLDEAPRGNLISGRDARHVANDLEAQLRDLQVKANLEAQEQFRQKVLAEAAEAPQAKPEAKPEAEPKPKSIEFPEPAKTEEALIGLEGGE